LVDPGLVDVRSLSDEVRFRIFRLPVEQGCWELRARHRPNLC
jgi:hypothetical protein